MSDSSKGIDVAHIATLARLRIEPGSVQKLQSEMESIVGYVEMLSELDVTGIEPTAHAVPRSNVLRDDVRGTPLGRDAMLANAPDTVDGYSDKSGFIASKPRLVIVTLMIKINR